jgi:hypothetical protein
MRLCDETGRVRAEIHADGKRYFTEDELNGMITDVGDTYTTAEVLKNLCPSFCLPNEFKVEWQPEAVDDLREIFVNVEGVGRHRDAMKKFLCRAVEALDPKLRACAPLVIGWAVGQQVLESERGLTFLFRAEPGARIVRIERVLQKSSPTASVSNPSSPTS